MSDKSNKERVESLMRKNPMLCSYNEVIFESHGGISMAFLNPREQHIFNYGLFEYKDFEDWANGKGKIVKGNTLDEKIEFFKLAKLERAHAGAEYIFWHYKYFNLIRDEHSQAPLVVTSDNHEEIISSSFGNIFSWYKELNMTDVQVKNMERELTGAKGNLNLLGVGYYGACNVPSPENLSWMSDTALAKALWFSLSERFPNDVPDYDFLIRHSR